MHQISEFLRYHTPKSWDFPTKINFNKKLSITFYFCHYIGIFEECQEIEGWKALIIFTCHQK
jgi:hypothetical protein